MSVSMAWVLLFIAGLFEIGWAIGLKYTNGFTNLVPTLLTISSMIISMYLLGKAASILPIGTAYAVWVGIGAVGAAVLGILLFRESVAPMKIFFLVTLLISIIGLKASAY